jgi:uncharacterized membrane protein YphA (DoxX/SURF4 family)
LAGVLDERRNVMNKGKSRLSTAARIVLGLIFTVFGLNGFLHFMPLPSPPPAAGAFLGALAATGYLFPLVTGIEVGAGLLLLAGRFVPLALVLLAPILVNIAAFHLFLAPGNYVVVGLALVAELTLAWSHRAAFRPLFAQPDTAAATRPIGEVAHAA